MEAKKAFEFLKNKNNSVLFIIILIGVILMMFSGGNDKKEDKSAYIPESYISDDAAELEDILSEIKGVGRVSVMITYYGGPETDIAYDTNTAITRRGEGNKMGSTEEKTDRQAVMSSGEPFVTRYLYPDVKGAVIAAEGAGDILIKQQIQQAASTVLGIDVHKVCVVEKKRE